MNSSKEMSIIIPHAGSFQEVSRLLESILNQTADFSLEIIIVANPANRYLSNPFSNISSVTYLTSEKGANCARNIGLQASSGQIVLFLDDDCVLCSNDYLKNCRELHQKNPSVVGIGGGYLLPPKASYFDRVYNQVQRRWIQNSFLPGGFISHLFGGNSSFKGTVLRNYSFDEEIHFGGTETELQVRLYWDGKPLVYSNSLNVLHHSKIGFRDFIKKIFKQGMGGSYIDSRLRRPPRYQTLDADIAGWGITLSEIAFSAGYKFFLKHKSLTVSNVQILRSFTRECLRRVGAHLKNYLLKVHLYRGLIDLKKFSSKHRHDQRSER